MPPPLLTVASGRAYWPHRGGRSAKRPYAGEGFRSAAREGFSGGGAVSPRTLRDSLAGPVRAGTDSRALLVSVNAFANYSILCTKCSDGRSSLSNAYGLADRR